MSVRRYALFATIAACIATFAQLTSVPAHAGAAAASQPRVIDDASLKPKFATVGGADVLPTTRTVAHWWGSALDPTDGVTYGYNMVGANPYSCTGSNCSITVEADIVPIIVNVAGLTFDGTSVVNAILNSPEFAGNDYGSTPFATGNAANLPRAGGGTLSQDDAGNLLQLQDAIMRAQFNQAGNSPYHLYLHPNVKPPVVINVAQNHGTLLQSGRGVVFADVDIKWWSSQISNLTTNADATHLPIYVTDDVLL
jgi:hypothetical protein